MKTLGTIFKACLFLGIVFLLVACDEPSGTLKDLTSGGSHNTDPDSGKLNEKYKYPKELWGEWIRMDTGRVWYIASNYIKDDDMSWYATPTME